MISIHSLKNVLTDNGDGNIINSFRTSQNCNSNQFRANDANKNKEVCVKKNSSIQDNNFEVSSNFLILKNYPLISIDQ